VQTGAPLHFFGGEEAMTSSEMRELVAFNAWANHRILGAAEALTAEQFTKELGSSFSSVRDTLVHIWAVEWVWLERLQGRSPSSFPNAKDFPDLASLRPRWEEVENNWLKYLSRLDESELQEEVDYKTMSFGPARNPRWQIMQHAVNHGSYHRGQVATMLRQLGTKGVGTDLILFYRERMAAAKS
jgi:uncharacterized damage-inducible protein DinB